MAVDTPLTIFAEWKLENTDGVEPVALVRSHERVVVFFTVRHQGTFLPVISIVLSLTWGLSDEQYEHWNREEDYQGFLVVRHIP